jgi:hypothetical protein
LERDKPTAPTAEIFGRLPTDVTGSFAIDTAFATWLSIYPPSSSLHITGMGVHWTQPRMRLYELGAGSRSCLSIVGRTTGSWRAGRILAPRQLSLSFSRTYTSPSGDPPLLTCQEADSRIPEGTAAAVAWSMQRVKVAGVCLQATVGNMTAQEQVEGLFDGLDILAAPRR